MFKNRSFQVKMVKDQKNPSADPAPNHEEIFAHAMTAVSWTAKEGMKVIAGTLVLNAGCKILINRLSK